MPAPPPQGRRRDRRPARHTGPDDLLLLADLTGPDVVRDLAGLPGASDRLADRGGTHMLESTYSDGHGLLVCPAGRRRDDARTLTTTSGVHRLHRDGLALVDLVVVDAPPAESVEGRIVCGAADRSLIVVEEARTTASEAVTVRDALREAGATTLGVVLVRDPDGLGSLDSLVAGPWTRHTVGGPGGSPVPAPRG